MQRHHIALSIATVVLALVIPRPGRAEPTAAAVGRSPALDDWEPYVGLLWRSRPGLLGLDARGRPVLEVARQTVLVADDGASWTPATTGAVATKLHPIRVSCRKDEESFNKPGTKRCEAQVLGGITLSSGERLAASDARGRHAVLTSIHRRWATLKDVAVSADGARWVAVWRSDTEDEVYGPTLFGIATGTVAGLHARLAAEPLRNWLACRKPGAPPDIAEARQLAPRSVQLAITLARVYARLGRDDQVLAVLRSHLAPGAITAYAGIAEHRELDRIRPQLRAVLAGAAQSQPSSISASATWRKQFVIGESRDGRYLALRRDSTEGCKGDHHRYLEIVEAAAPFRQVAILKVEHLDVGGGKGGGDWLALNRRAAADDLLAAFGFVQVPLVKATSVAGVDPKRRFRYSPERLGVVSVQSSSTARLLRGGKVAAEVRLPGQKWGHGNGTVEEVAVDLQRRRAFLMWGEARPECCAGDARMPLDHDQISILPLP
jgi:hypothetical protein